MEYNHKIIDFCEKKLYPDRPEYINCISALYISYIGYYNLIKNYNNSKKIGIIYWCIITNGFASFYYHYTAWYIFKMYDEITMIIPLWLAFCILITELNYSVYYIGLLTIININIIVLNIFIWFHKFFPIIFALQLLLIIPIYVKVLKLTNHKITKKNLINNKCGNGIIVCSLSGIIWIITETNCNKYMIFGHSIWHIGMSTGLCYILEYFNYQVEKIK